MTPDFSSTESDSCDIKTAFSAANFCRERMAQNNRKSRHFSQCLSAEILAKNTISCGIFSLPTKPVVLPPKNPPSSFLGINPIGFFADSRYFGRMSLTQNFLLHPDQFVRRHIGPNDKEAREMLALLGHKNLDDLIDAAVPQKIRAQKKLNLPAARSEFEALAELKRVASENKVFRSFIGQGYYDTITPPVIQRNVLENPGWYTQYTPYQAEISQGRLESLLNFQTVVTDLTAMDIANASLLDESTACAEAMMMSHRLKANDGRNTFFISENCHPQNIEVVRTRGAALGVEVIVGNHETYSFSEKVFGALVQYPDTFGAIHDYSGMAEKVHAA